MCELHQLICNHSSFRIPEYSQLHKYTSHFSSNVGDSAKLKGQIAYFSLRMRETAIFLHSVKHLTSPYLWPRFAIGLMNCGDSVISKGQMAYFPLRVRETAKFLFSIKNLTTPSCSPTPISYMMQEFWRFGHGPNCIFFIAHARNAYNSTSGQKSHVTIVFADPDFLHDAEILAIRP